MIDAKVEAKKRAEELFISNYWQACYSKGFSEGAKWLQEEILKSICHSPEEEPKNLEYIVFITDIFGEDYLFTKQVYTKDWKTEVETCGIKQWAYRDDIVFLIFKGGKNERT